MGWWSLALALVATIAGCSDASSKKTQLPATAPVLNATSTGGADATVAAASGGANAGPSAASSAGAASLASAGQSAASSGAGGQVGAAGSAAAGSTAAGASGLAPSGLPDVKFAFDLEVPAGGERLMCKYVQFPSDRGVIAVPSAESHYTPGSHHLLAYRSDYTSLPPDQPGLFDCGMDFSWEQHNTGSYYEAQQPDSRRDLPPGVAAEFKPGEVMILQAHYVNSTTKDVTAHIELILHTVDVKTVKQEAGSIIFADLDINIAPHSKSRTTMTCPVPQDIDLALLWSHMHRRGVNFVVTTNDAAATAAAGGALYTESDWSEPTPRSFPYDPAVVVHAGSTITFSCDFQNDDDKTYVYGNSAENNEMCLLHGMYWPRNTSSQGFERCFGGMSSMTPL